MKFRERDEENARTNGIWERKGMPKEDKVKKSDKQCQNDNCHSRLIVRKWHKS